MSLANGQYFHYLGMWIFALTRLGAIEETYRRRALAAEIAEMRDACSWFPGELL